MGGQVGKGQKRKKGNPGVGVDFKKVKHKVGKKLPKAQNDTDTSFKARSINLPSQAVKDDKGGTATNFQNLTLKELLSQTSHYSDKTRKAALSGLNDLFTRHPHELTGHVGLVFSKLVERICDSEEGVRTGLQSLLRDTVCRRVMPGQIRPFMPMIMAHVSGATTHLSLDIRNDALVFLDILMDYYPQLIASSFLLPCLSHFCDLLSSGHRSRSIKGQSLKSLLTVLKALCDFLRRAFPASATQPGSGAQPQPQLAPRRLPLYRHRCAWPASQPSSAPSSLTPSAPQKSTSSKAGTAGQATAGHAPAGQQQGSQGVAEAAQKLLLLLMECWPECSPATLSVSPTLEQATALVYVLTACRQLMDHVLSPAAVSCLPTASSGGQGLPGSWQVPSAMCQLLLKGIAPHFPVTMPAVRPAPAVLDHMVQYNLGCSQVLVRLLPASLQAQPGQDVQQPQLPGWAYALVDFYEGVLRTGQVVPAGGLMSEAQTLQRAEDTGGRGTRPQAQPTASNSSDGTQGQTSTAARLSVLCGVEEVVGVVHVEVVGRLVAAVDAMAGASAPRSSLRAACLQMQHRLMKRWQEGSLYLDPAWVAAWLGGLPRLLWELGTSSPSTSGLVLAMLHDAARFSPCAPASADAPGEAGQVDSASPLQAALQQLQPQLAPLLAVQLPAPKGKLSKSPAGTASGGALPVTAGPITKLPEPLQLLAIDLLYHLGPPHPSLLSAALRCVHHQLLPSHCCLRLVEACMHMAARSPPATAASVLLTLLFAAPSHSPAPTQQPNSLPGPTVTDESSPAAARVWVARQWQVSGCVLSMAQTIAPASVLIQLLSSQLQQLLQPVLAPTNGSGPMQVIHVHCILKLCALALEEQAAGQRDAVPLPAWLNQALPTLAIWYCMHEASDDSGSAPPPSAQSGIAAASMPGRMGAWDDHAGSVLALQLCAAQPQLAAQLLDAAAASAGRLRLGGAQQTLIQSQCAVHYVAALTLARKLLQDPLAKRQLLAGTAQSCALVQRLVSQEGLPGHVTADMACMSAVQQLRHVADDVLGV